MVGEIESRLSTAKIESFIIRLELMDLKGFLWSDTLRRVLLPPLQIKAFESVHYKVFFAKEFALSFSALNTFKTLLVKRCWCTIYKGNKEREDFEFTAIAVI